MYGKHIPIFFNSQMKYWKKRILTPIGLIAVVKKINYSKTQPFYSKSEKQITLPLYENLFKFILNSKNATILQEKIPLKTLWNMVLKW